MHLWGISRDFGGKRIGDYRIVCEIKELVIYAIDTAQGCEV